MKTYEIGFRTGDNYDEDHFILWIKTDGKIETHTGLYCKEIDIGEAQLAGLDLIVRTSNEEDIT